MTIVLAESSESWRVLSKDTFKHVGSDRILVHVPHLVDELGVGHHQATLRA